MSETLALPNKNGVKVIPEGAHIPSHGHGWLKPVQPGEVRNPTGKGGALRDAQRLAQQSTPHAIKRLIAMLDSTDDRVVVVAANSLWEKAGGKVMEDNPERDNAKRVDLSKLSLPELQFLLKLVRSGAMQMTEPVALPGGEHSITITDEVALPEGDVIDAEPG